jgi:hypothetical protein
MDIVIDFDGTCVTHEFPNVGKNIGAERVLKKLLDHGHNLILFTMRSDLNNPTYRNMGKELPPGNYLHDAIDWFRRNDVKLYGIQRNPSQDAWTSSPKAYGQLIIDDAALGCPLIFDENLSSRPFADWEAIEDMLEYMGFFRNEKTRKNGK